MVRADRPALTIPRVIASATHLFSRDDKNVTEVSMNIYADEVPADECDEGSGLCTGVRSYRAT